jgi:hypothetical protein
MTESAEPEGGGNAERLFPDFVKALRGAGRDSQVPHPRASERLQALTIRYIAALTVKKKRSQQK